MGEKGLHKIGLIGVLEQTPQLADFIGRKFVPLDKVSEHGLQRPAENALQKRLAGGINTLLPPDQWAIQRRRVLPC